MTGREQVTLAAFVQFATDAFARLDQGQVRLEGKVDKIDERVRGLEQTDARQAGMADGQTAAVAHANVVNQRIEGKRAAWRDSWRTLFAVIASVATIAGVIVGAILKFV